jgi:hypothetical protein
MYVIPSSPVDPIPSGSIELDDEGAIANLAKRVSAYLARVVGALADFEDRLLEEDGFFAREEHFEAQIDSLRREFEANQRAAVRPRLPTAPAALASLVARRKPLGDGARRFLAACSRAARRPVRPRRRSSAAPTRCGCSSPSSSPTRRAPPRAPTCTRAGSSSSSSPRRCC